MSSLHLKSKVTPLILAIMLLAAISIGAAGVVNIANAAPVATNVTAQLNPGYTIIVDGVQQNFFNSSGSPVYPLVYNGTTYLPLRAIGELMNKNVNWDEANLTVSLAGTRNAAPTLGRPAPAKQQYVNAQLRPDFTIMLDGVRRSFTNSDGTYVYPLLYNGSVYLPLRAIGELMGKNVDWNGYTSTITLSGGGNTGSGGSTVTDADSFGTSTQPGNPSVPGTSNPDNQPQVMSNDEARAAALRQVPGATENNIVKLKLEYDDGRWQYDVEIYYNFTEYEMELDAYTGALLDMDVERDEYLYQQSHQRSSAAVQTVSGNLYCASNCTLNHVHNYEYCAANCSLNHTHHYEYCAANCSLNHTHNYKYCAANCTLNHTHHYAAGMGHHVASRHHR